MLIRCGFNPKLFLALENACSWRAMGLPSASGPVGLDTEDSEKLSWVRIRPPINAADRIGREDTVTFTNLDLGASGQCGLQPRLVHSPPLAGDRAW